MEGVKSTFDSCKNIEVGRQEPEGKKKMPKMS